jgi:2-aminoadipate transaminase
LGRFRKIWEEKIKKYHPKFVISSPTYQNPTGRTLPVERRKKIAQIAAKYETLILEDDPYRDLRYEGEALPAIRSFDESGYVIYLSSFSKTISPGLRVGAILAPAELPRKLVICKQAAICTPRRSTRRCRRLLPRGLLFDHINEALASYGAQMNKMHDMLSHFPRRRQVRTAQAAPVILADLPEHIDAGSFCPSPRKRRAY